MVFFPGEYKVQLPDGRVQIVSYEADDYGFRPTVHYEYPHGDPHQALDIVGPPPHHHPGTWQQPSQFTAKILHPVQRFFALWHI